MIHGKKANVFLNTASRSLANMRGATLSTLPFITGFAVILGGCFGEIDFLSDDTKVTERGPNDPLGTGAPQYDDRCWTSPGSKLFGNALCLCDDLKDIGVLTVKPGPNEAGASFAANGVVQLASHLDVDGSFVPYGGLLAGANVEIRDSFSTAKDVNVAGRVDVGQNMAVGGNLFGIGVVSVKGVLSVGGTATVLGYRDAKETAPYSPIGGPPCACDAQSAFDVKGAVERARHANDNAINGLSTSLANIGYSVLNLTSGKYYFNDVSMIGRLQITVQGTVALYLDGSLDSIGMDTIEVQPDSTLDLYVSGSVRTIGHTVLGNDRDPSTFRLYVGGTEPLMISVGNQEFHGAVYAPQAPITYVGRTVVRGGLFGKTLESVGLLEVNYDQPDPTPPENQICPPTQEQPTPEGELPPDPDAIYNDLL